MRLYDEIFQNPDGGALARCVVVPCGGGYFEGVKWVDDFSTERVVVRFPKQRVEVAGENLSIRKYCDGDLRLIGKILSFRVMDGEE